MEFSKLNPFIRSAGLYEVINKTGECVAYDSRVIYMISGDVTVGIENEKKFHLAAGNLLFIPAGYDYSITANKDEDVLVVPFYIVGASFDEIFKPADYITLHVPATPTTKNMICEKSIALMKQGVRIINLARADLVNAADIKEALESGKVSAYVTDFPTPKTMGVKGIINIPHLGASTEESEDNCAVMAACELDDFLTTGNIKNSVNYPSVSIPHTGAARICIAHLNIANVLSGVTGIVSAEGINIENLSNGSKGDYAYTIVEIGVKVPESIIPKIEAIEGVIRVRVIE